MNERLIQPRIYKDTFKGGEFELELREKLSLIVPFGKDLDSVSFTCDLDPSIEKQIEDMWSAVRA